MTDSIEYRSFGEFRFDAAAGVIEGVVMRYGDTAKLGRFEERFEPGSLTVSDDALVNIQHNRQKPVARLGRGLTISQGRDTTLARIELPKTAIASEARELVDAGILRGLSIEFRAEVDEWRGRTRVVSKAIMTGLGIVDTPAYPDSVLKDVALRWSHANPSCAFTRYAL